VANDAWEGAWRAATRALGGVVDMQLAAAPYPSKINGSVEVNGVRVQLQGWLEPSGTGISARVPDAAWLSFEVQRGRVVKTDMLSVAKAWLDEPVRAMMQRAPAYVYHLDRGVATGGLERIDDDAARLEAAIRAVALLAGRSGRAIARWQELAEGIGARYTGLTLPLRRYTEERKPSPFAALELEADEPRGQVVVDVWVEESLRRKRGKQAMFTRARCRRATGNEAFNWKPGEEAPATLEGEARERFLGLGLHSASTEREHVTLLYPGLLDGADTARTLISLTASLADGRARPQTRGPYR
jgi:hypothetical protein